MPDSCERNAFEEHCLALPARRDRDALRHLLYDLVSDCDRLLLALGIDPPPRPELPHGF